jgi:TonB family protein
MFVVRSSGRKNLLAAALLFLAFCAAAFPAFAQNRKSKEEIEAHIRALEQKKQQEQQAKRMQATNAGPTGAELEAIITKYEKLLDGCAYKKSDRCADVMYTLGALYYDQGRMENKERNSPVPDYSKSFNLWWRLSIEYPNFPKLPDAFFQMGQCYLVAGHLDTARIVLEELSRRFPNSPRVSAAQFRLGELAFRDNNYGKAYEHFKKVKNDQVDIISREMNHYRLAECAYNLGEYGKAVEYFYSYAEACDRNEYQKKEFRELALEYMAIAFSEMPDGADKAIKFFNKNKGKPYEAQVVYMIGAKNREHGQWDAAIRANESALKKYPLYREAPFARRRLIECYTAKNEHEKANRERTRLADDYRDGSKWRIANPTSALPAAPPPAVPGESTGGAPTGGRSRASIQSVITQNMAAMLYAYNRRLSAKPGIAGKIAVKFSVNEFGRVISADITESTVSDSKLESMVVSLLKSWDFGKIDKPGDVTEITYPFAFSQ